MIVEHGKIISYLKSKSTTIFTECEIIFLQFNSIGEIIRAMKLQTYLKRNKTTATKWAKANKLPVSTVWRAANGKVENLRVSTIKAILSKAGPDVTIFELLGVPKPKACPLYMDYKKSCGALKQRERELSMNRTEYALGVDP